MLLTMKKQSVLYLGILTDRLWLRDWAPQLFPDHCNSPSFPMTYLMHTLDEDGHWPDEQCLSGRWGALQWCYENPKAWHCSRGMWSKVWIPLRWSETWQTRASRGKHLGEERVGQHPLPCKSANTIRERILLTIALLSIQGLSQRYWLRSFLKRVK